MRPETEELLRESARTILTRDELNQLRVSVLLDFGERGLSETILKEWDLEFDEHLRLRGFLTSSEAYRLIEMLEVRCRKSLRPTASIAVEQKKPIRKKRPHLET